MGGGSVAGLVGRAGSRWGRRRCAALRIGVGAGVRDGAAARTAASVETLFMEGHLGRAGTDRADGCSLSTRPAQTVPGLPLTLTAPFTVPDCRRSPTLLSFLFCRRPCCL